MLRLQVQSGGVDSLCEWQGHELEAWMATWDKHKVMQPTYFTARNHNVLQVQHMLACCVWCGMTAAQQG
jgi:hypothetical protein